MTIEPIHYFEVRLACRDCGMEYNSLYWLDVTLSNEQWAIITCKEKGIVVLCGGCICKRAARLEVMPGVPRFITGRLTLE